MKRGVVQPGRTPALGAGDLGSNPSSATISVGTSVTANTPGTTARKTQPTRDEMPVGIRRADSVTTPSHECSSMEDILRDLPKERLLRLLELVQRVLKEHDGRPAA